MKITRNLCSGEAFLNLRELVTPGSSLTQGAIECDVSPDPLATQRFYSGVQGGVENPIKPRVTARGSDSAQGRGDGDIFQEGAGCWGMARDMKESEKRGAFSCVRGCDRPVHPHGRGGVGQVGPTWRWAWSGSA